MTIKARIDSLRKAMRKARVDAYFVPGTDPHQSEYLPECWQRREWLSGFTGSAGELLVTLNNAYLWTDGRYFLQAEQELAGSGIELMRMGQPGVPSVEQHATDILGKRKQLGVDPKLLSIARARNFEAALNNVGAQLCCLEQNLVDLVWSDRPPLPCNPVEALSTRFAGETVARKLERVRAVTAAAGAKTLVLTTLDAIAWLFNIRGRDVEYNPVAIAYALVTQKEAILFIEAQKLSAKVKKHLAPTVRIRDYQDFGTALSKLRGAVLVDTASASHFVQMQLQNAQIIAGELPVSRMKAAKNAVELAGMHAAHLRDGVAMVKFLRWLDESMDAGEKLTELDAAEKLRSFRALGQHFKGLSFRTISGYGANGAIIHYSVSAQSNKALRPSGLYLVDSGGQYLDGTTDITRTIALGNRTTKTQRDAYTRVLKGHIALAQARFPHGTTGARLDTLARQYLWQVGLDYNHGTGHGVGAYLNVHEGPQSISPRSQSAPLEPGNIQSNEPGYYEPGKFGIRIENLIEVVEMSAPARSNPTLGFRTLTLCPIDKRPIEAKLLDERERKWLDQYHAKVQAALLPHLDPPDRKWLRAACSTL